MSAPAYRGVIADDSPMRGAVRLAGALAEAGVGELELINADGSAVKLAARTTDLPGEVVNAAAGSELVGLRVRVKIDAGALRWETADAGIAERLALAGQSASE